MSYCRPRRVEAERMPMELETEKTTTTMGIKSWQPLRPMTLTRLPSQPRAQTRIHDTQTRTRTQLQTLQDRPVNALVPDLVCRPNQQTYKEATKNPLFPPALPLNPNPNQNQNPNPDPSPNPIHSPKPNTSRPTPSPQSDSTFSPN